MTIARHGPALQLFDQNGDFVHLFSPNRDGMAK
jgi:hypothetical protein